MADGSPFHASLRLPLCSFRKSVSYDVPMRGLSWLLEVAPVRIDFLQESLSERHLFAHNISTTAEGSPSNPSLPPLLPHLLHKRHRLFEIRLEIPPPPLTLQPLPLQPRPLMKTLPHRILPHIIPRTQNLQLSERSSNIHSSRCIHIDRPSDGWVELHRRALELRLVSREIVIWSTPR